jgi:hypothetical protein
MLAQAEETDAAWRVRYERARAALIDERFAEAQAELDALAHSAPTEPDRRVAIELREVARVKAERHGQDSQNGQPAIRDSDEMSVLYTTAVLYGLGTGGWLTLQLQPQTFGTAIIPFAVATTAAVGGLSIADRYRPLRHGIPHAIAAGLYLGFGEGMWLVAYQHAYSTQHAGTSSWHAERVSSALWIGASAGAVVGGLIGALRRPTPGRVSFTASAGIWLGVLSAFAADALNPESKGRAQTTYLVGDIGYNAGLLTGILFGPEFAPSVTRVRFMDLGGLGGALLGAGSYALVANERGSQGSMGAAAIGGALGLALTFWATSGMQPDRSHDKLPSALGSRSPSSSALRAALMPARGGFVAVVTGEL